MKVMQLAGRINYVASAPFYYLGERSSTEQGEREIGAISPKSVLRGESITYDM